MNWFERHLNWSLFLGIILLPSIVVLIFFFIFFSTFYSGVAGIIASGGGEPEIMGYLLSTVLPFYVIYLFVGLALSVFAFVVTWWYLGRKSRSKWFLLLLFVPFGIIILLLLENRAIGHGGDFTGELETVRWQDTGHLSVYDRQLKELEYRDTGISRDVGDAGDVKDVSAAREETPAEDKVSDRPIKYEPLKMPILLDDEGKVIRCFYHPGADAVNFCSRCGQYVCKECNYVTGTHPICHNCWDKRAETPVITAPAERQKSVESGKTDKQKSMGLEKSEWFQEFMELYDQASPIINGITRKSADGMPASPLDLMEGLKLRPMLERTKKLSKPKSKEFVEAKKEFEQVLSSCIKIADAAADFVGGGGQAMLGGPDYKRIVDEIEIANGLMEKLSQTLTPFSQSHD